MTEEDKTEVRKIVQEELSKLMVAAVSAGQQMVYQAIVEPNAVAATIGGCQCDALQRSKCRVQYCPNNQPIVPFSITIKPTTNGDTNQGG